MPTDAKRQEVAELTEMLSGSSSAIVADYRGLTVADMGAVRRTLRDQGINYRVVKNRLARIAADQAGLGELGPLLEGPSSLAVGSADEVVVARTFLDATRPYRAVSVRGGVIRGRRIDADAVTALAALPGREVLLSQLAGGIAAPLTGLASLLSAPLRNLGYALQQLADRKAEGGGIASVATGESPTPEAPGGTASSSAP
jgi:large subunit ribosomal protein L10